MDRSRAQNVVQCHRIVSCQLLEWFIICLISIEYCVICNLFFVLDADPEHLQVYETSLPAFVLI